MVYIEHPSAHLHIRTFVHYPLVKLKYKNVNQALTICGVSELILILIYRIVINY